MRQEQYAAAVDCYTHAIELDDRNAVYYCNRSVMSDDAFLVVNVVTFPSHTWF